jgi:hypothetical protein
LSNTRHRPAAGRVRGGRAIVASVAAIARIALESDGEEHEPYAVSGSARAPQPGNQALLDASQEIGTVTEI